MERLLWAAFARYEDTNALDHLGSGAGALGQEDIGTAGAVERGDGAGDDHGGQTRMNLFGAAHQLIAVHLRHQQIAEEQIERSGNRLLNNLKRLLRAVYGDHAVTARFKQKGTDGENLFIVVNAEDRLLGAHAISHSAGLHG